MNSVYITTLIGRKYHLTEKHSKQGKKIKFCPDIQQSPRQSNFWWDKLILTVSTKTQPRCQFHVMWASKSSWTYLLKLGQQMREGKMSPGWINMSLITQNNLTFLSPTRVIHLGNISVAIFEKFSASWAMPPSFLLMLLQIYLKFTKWMVKFLRTALSPDLRQIKRR